MTSQISVQALSRIHVTFVVISKMWRCLVTNAVLIVLTPNAIQSKNDHRDPNVTMESLHNTCNMTRIDN